MYKVTPTGIAIIVLFWVFCFLLSGAREDLFHDTLGALLKIANSLNLKEDVTADDQQQASDIEALARVSDRRTIIHVS